MDVELRFYNRFIYVEVDISIYIYMRYSQGDGVNTSMSRLVYCTHVIIYYCIGGLVFISSM